MNRSSGHTCLDSDNADSRQQKFTDEIFTLISATIRPDLILLFVREGARLNLMASRQNRTLKLHEEILPHTVGECLCGLAVHEGSPVYCSDILTDPRCTWEECKKNGLRSFAALPLLDGDQVVGILGLASLTQRDFSTQKMIIEPLAAAISISFRNTLLLNRQMDATNLIRLNESRLESLLRITQMEFASHQELLDFTLEESIKLTESRVGYIYYFDEKSREFELNSWSKGVMKECSITEPRTIYHLEQTGIWGEAVRQRRPVIINDFHADHPLKRGYPQGHAPLDRFLTIPVFNNGSIVAVVGVANKSAPYDENDTRLLTLIMDTVWKIVEQKRAVDKLSESERRFRQLFEKMTEGVALHRLIKDSTGVPVDYMIIDVNPAFEKILGYARDEVIGKTASTAYNLTPPPFLEHYTSVVSSGRSVDFEIFYAPMNRFFNITVLPWENNGFATIFFDVTEHKLNEDASKKALGFVETLLKSSPMGIRVFEGDSGRCIMANQAAADIAGATIEQLLSQNFRELDSWKDAGIRQLADKVLSDGIATPIETDLLTTFGKHVKAMYFLSRFISDDKPHLMVIGRDITEEKHLEEENRRIEAQMLHVQKLESLGVLAGGIAHDFNNILMAILGNAELAMKILPAASPAANNIREIESAARRAADLSHQMLAYSGKGHFLVEALDVNKVICEMATLLDVSVSKKATLYLDLKHDLPHVKADMAQLSQVIMNLIINASEAIEDKIGDITISTGTMECNPDFFAKSWIVDSLPEGTYVYIKITDTGCGMDKETIDKIYEPFFTTKFTGRGLGMAAVIGIIRGHKGAITVDSKKGQGTIFTVLLPAAKESTVEADLKTIYSETLKGSGTILLVDDEESIRHMGQAMLEMFGFQALTAPDGFAALDLFRQHREEIVCVILDLTMPNMDGEQTFTELRKIDPNVKVIMSSGYTELEIENKFQGKGLTGFIQKPYQIIELEKKLQDIIM